jgi:putative solute:sodium symporter small subunit
MHDGTCFGRVVWYLPQCVAGWLCCHVCSPIVVCQPKEEWPVTIAPTAAIIRIEALFSLLCKEAPVDRKQRAEAYWKENSRLIMTLLAIWFVVAYIPPLFIEQFNQIVIAGFPLGYYMGSQGSLIVFVVLIFYYAFAMNKMDEKYGLKDK